MALPLALSVKTVLSEGRTYFQDSATYRTHRDFAVDQLAYPRGMPFVGEYLDPQRRLLSGAVTRYEGPDVWAYELAPYDTASPEQVEQAFRAIQQAAYFGPLLRLHVTSPEQGLRRAGLDREIPIVTSDVIYAGTSYQPLNLGTTVAQVHLTTEAALAGAAIGPRELVVLDRAPFDISVVAGIVTAEPQTPLSYVNAQRLGLDDYFKFCCDARELMRAPRGDGEVHRVLGNPDAIEGEMTRQIVYEVAKAKIDRPKPALEADKLRLLLQIDSDERAEMMWGDLGRLFFWIREDDLAAANFSNVTCVLQCG